jgi:hypothetical protein
MKKLISLVPIILGFLLAGCEYDNYDKPGTELSGNVVYNSQNIGVRSNGNQLELWQDGYDLCTKLPVYISWDGTFHAKVFDGEYKIVRLGGAPWENQTDTILITVRGNTEVDVPVIPYFIVPSDVVYRKATNTVTAKFAIQKVSNSATLESASLYLNKSIITDQNYNDANVSVPASEITLGHELAITVNIPEVLTSADYIFARVGIKTSGVGERYYTIPEKISMK